MAEVTKQDSNSTGLAYAEEASLGVLSSPTWYRLNPNSYDDFGGQITTVSPNPINPSRQRRKGVTTDLDADGGINHNLTQTNLTHLMQGMLFANIRRKGRLTSSGISSNVISAADTGDAVAGSLLSGTGLTNSANNGLLIASSVITDTSITVEAATDETPPAGHYIDIVGYEGADGDITVDVSGDLPVLASSSLDFTTLGLVPGQWIYIGGDTAGSLFPDAANNGWKRIRTIATNALTIDKSELAMVTDADTTGIELQIFFGDVLKNETGTDIVRRTYHVERTLGAPDDASPNDIQSEVLVGAVPSEFTLNVPSAELLNVDFSWIATDNVQRLAAAGPLQSSVQIFPAASEFNTSSDVPRLRLAAVSDTDESPAAAFAYVTEATITINNNLQPLKAVGVLGAFEVSAGTFEVGGELTAYFANVQAVQNVRNNTNITLDMIFAKDNAAIVFDLPLISLGNGRLAVEQDEPITLPLETAAATGEDVDPELDHTLLITYFNYLPNAAM